MLRIDALHKRYGERTVLRGVSLDVPAGTVCGLVGSNGAGKTTLISIATGLITADAGSVRVGRGDAADIDVRRRRGAASACTGLAPQELGIYPMLSARENLQTLGELSGMGRRAARNRCSEVLAALDLEAQASQRADTLSGGQARRLHTGMALMHRPAVLFLDEPTVGADIAARSAILALVRSLADEGAAVVYTTHYLTELSELRSEVAILHDGAIAVRGELADVVAAHAAPSIALVTTGRRPALTGWTSTPSGDGTVRWDAPPELVRRGEAVVLADALARLGEGTTLEGVEVTPASLDTAFLAITGHRLTAEEEPHVVSA